MVGRRTEVGSDRGPGTCARGGGTSVVTTNKEQTRTLRTGGIQ